MKRMLLVLVSGLVAGLAAHVAWFQVRRPCSGDELSCQLAWMKTELKLTDAQYARVRQIHESSSPKLLALAAQLSQMKEEYAAFERERVTEGKVDFLEFARWYDRRRAVDRECLALTNELVAATSSAMTPEQRERYLGLIGPDLHPAGGSSPQL